MAFMLEFVNTDSTWPAQLEDHRNARGLFIRFLLLQL